MKAVGKYIVITEVQSEQKPAKVQKRFDKDSRD